MVKSIKLWMLHCTITALFFAGPVYCARNELLATADCVCLGETLVYNCSVVGGLLTVWRGSVIDGNCEIALLHDEFRQDGGPNIECNSGDVVGRGISAQNDCYVSRLSVEVNPSVSGSIVECIRDDGVATSLVGNTSIQISTSPAPSPESIRVVVNNQVLMFTWPRVNYLCQSLSYNFTTSHSCGDCKLTSSTTVLCSAFTTPSMCEFSVRSVICGNITGEAQTEAINLQVPDVPIVRVVPHYLSGRTRSLTKLTTTFARGDPISITDGIDGSAQSFTVTYSDSTFGTVCGMASISASACINGTCRHTFDILESSSCPATTSIVTTVYANSVLGRGPSSASVTRDGINNLVDVSFSQVDHNIICSFFNQPDATLKMCYANITYGENCDQQLKVYSAEDTESIVQTPLEIRADITNYCFVVTAASNNVTVMVEGEFVSRDLDSNSAATAAAVSTTLIVLLLVVVVAIISGLLWILYRKRESEHIVKFAVEGGADSIARAFDQFKKHGIKVIGGNTEEKTFGPSVFCVKCFCSRSTIELLTADLTSMGAKDVNIQLPTHKSKSEKAIQFLVRDQVGALAGTLQEFIVINLKIRGVNVDHLRGAKKHTKVNYIECSLDDQTLGSLMAALNKAGCECEEDTSGRITTDQNYRILKTTVPNETVALYRTLKAFSDLKINIRGVNSLDPAYEIDHDIKYKHYHAEIVTTHEQFAKLTNALYSKGVATDIKEFDISKHSDTSEFLQQYQHRQVSEDNFIPTTMMIEFLVRNEGGALAETLKVFGKLGISISKINPAHMGSHHQSDCLGCFCEEDKRETLRHKILSCGATEVPPNVAGVPSNYFVVKYSAGSKIMDILKAFQEIGVDITTTNPTRIKLLNQYVECCCDDDTRENLLSKLGNIKGVVDVKHLQRSEEHASEPRPDNYCVIEFSMQEEAGILFKALKAFFDLKINIIGINALNPVFEIKKTHAFKHCHIVFVGTNEQEEELIKNVSATGLAIDVKPYKRQTRHAGAGQGGAAQDQIEEIKVDAVGFKVGTEEVMVDVETEGQ